MCISMATSDENDISGQHKTVIGAEYTCYYDML